jgi:HK97 family phage major capsid protein
MPSRASTLAAQARQIGDKAYDEGRALTPAEQGKIESLIEQAKEASSLERQLKELDGDASWLHGDAPAGKGPGDEFIASEGYKSISDSSRRGQSWSTGAIELKSTLTETPGTALVQAGYESGVVSTLFQQLYVADLLPSRPAPGNPVRYVSESTATNAAAAVAEGAAKPESTLAFSEVSEPIRKIATFLPVSDEMLEDAPQIQSYLNERLSLFVRTTGCRSAPAPTAPANISAAARSWAPTETRPRHRRISSPRTICGYAGTGDLQYHAGHRADRFLAGCGCLP